MRLERLDLATEHDPEPLPRAGKDGLIDLEIDLSQRSDQARSYHDGVRGEFRQSPR